MHLSLVWTSCCWPNDLLVLTVDVKNRKVKEAGQVQNYHKTKKL